MSRSTTSRKAAAKAQLKRIGAGLAVAAFWLAVWQAAYTLVAQEILLVSPVQAVMRLLSLMGGGLFWRSVFMSCLRVLAGFSCALVVGTVLAAAGARLPLVRRLVSPLMGIVRATPVASFIILVLVWIVTDRIPMVIAFLMVVPIVWGNVGAGIAGADSELLEMAAVFKIGRGKILRYIYIPAVLPHFVSACSAGLGFAWKSAVAAEVISPPKLAVGRQLNNAKIYLDTADLFAWTMAVILMSLLIEKLAMALLRMLAARLGAAPTEGRATDAAES